MFYWSYQNFKMVEFEFETRIKSCISFLPIDKPHLEHGAFSLENGKCFYVLEGMLGFHIFEVSRMVSDEDTIFLSDNTGVVKLLDKKTLSPIAMNRVMGLPLINYDDAIPRLIHEDEDKRPNHCIVIGHEPEDNEDMVCVQKYHDGFRTVWMSQETLKSPVIIDDNYYSLGLPEEIESFCDYIDESKDEIEEKGRQIPRTSFINCLYVDFVYDEVFYRMFPRAFDLHPEIFECILDGVVKHLIEIGAPYVNVYKEESW